MEDRELLVMAAKAAGIELDWDVPPRSPPWRISGKGEDRGPAAQWDPLGDDGDSMMLVMALGMQLHVDLQYRHTHVRLPGDIGWRSTAHSGNVESVTRRAIVNAAVAQASRLE